MDKEKEKSTFTIEGVEFDRGWPEAADKKYPSFMTLEGFAACQTRPPKSWLGDLPGDRKDCKLCGNRFPATDEYFYKSGKYKSKKTGEETTKLSSYCKECDKNKAILRAKSKVVDLSHLNIEYDPALHGEKPSQLQLYNNAVDGTPIQGWQKCSKCEEWKPKNRAHFKYKRGRPGIQVPRFSGTCKDCDRITRRSASHQKKIREGLKGVHGREGWPLDDPDKKIAEAEAYLQSHTLTQLQDMYDVSPAEAPEDELNEQDANNTNVGCTSTTEECGCRVLPISKTA